jgi:hypothetical protein
LREGPDNPASSATRSAWPLVLVLVLVLVPSRYARFSASEGVEILQG